MAASFLRRASVWGMTLLFAIVAPVASAQCDPQWLPGDGIPGVDGTVRASILWDPDGSGPLPAQLIIGGSFQFAGSSAVSNIARWDGTTWQPLGAGADGEVRAFTVAPNGDLLVGGAFNSIGGPGVAGPGIARWNGSTWSGIGTNLAANVRAIAVMPNGDIVAGGDSIINAHPTEPCGVARWNGTTWLPLFKSFALGPLINFVNAVAVLPNGDIIAGGLFGSVEGTVNALGIARWNGTEWSSLGNTAFLGVRALAVLANGDLVVGGSFSSITAGLSANCLARWNGTSWTAYTDYAWTSVHSIAVQPNGDLLVAGKGARWFAARWNGSNWNNVAPDVFTTETPGGGTLYTALALANGDTFVGGFFNQIAGKGANSVAVRSGTVWNALGTGANDTILASVVMPNGDIIAAGRFLTIGNITANRIARWDGIRWWPLGSGVNADVNALAVLPNGNLVAGGVFTNAGGVTANGIAQWNGSAWSTIGNQFAGQVYALAIASNGDLVAGGNTLSANAATLGYVARWGGGNWAAVGSGPNNTVRSLVGLTNGHIIAGGDFVYSPATPPTISFVARWNGSTWVAMQHGFNGQTFALLQRGNGDIVAGGGFSTLGTGAGVNLNCLARWSGSLWASLWTATPTPDSNPQAIHTLDKIPGDGLIAAGLFGKIGGLNNANNIVYKPGTLWTPMGTGTDGRTPAVYAARSLAGREIIAAGAFSRAGGLPSGRFARWAEVPKPWIAAAPIAPPTKVAHESFSLTATPAVGYSNVSFQWQRETTPGVFSDIVNGPGGASLGGGTVTDASGPLASPTNGAAVTLTLTDIRHSDAGRYRVVFFNSCGQSESGPITVIIKGAVTDLNADGLVDDADFVLFAVQYNALECSDPAMPDGCSADFNQDGFVDDADFIIFATAYDQLIPE
ncbi:MAG TPA: hypothetical protein VF777_01155 [Phycisphaerales bacterium]